MGARKQAGTGSLTCAQGLCGSKSEDSNPPQDTVTQRAQSVELEKTENHIQSSKDKENAKSLDKLEE
ncbi:hypothetical protein MJG53_001256 [Ovis ammon polii x Ovis aries]|uniref:Uncharacterized protein n=1 Tax=Ovis ammon polii x Ovis aries TaxID=2918886 RepID=A0ACB9VJU7_9CETA|nr:hypothetical protein MJG53_001256 [Ovis ammon polii x Ovis aries]